MKKKKDKEREESGTKKKKWQKAKEKVRKIKSGKEARFGQSTQASKTSKRSNDQYGANQHCSHTRILNILISTLTDTRRIVTYLTRKEAPSLGSHFSSSGG